MHIVNNENGKMANFDRISTKIDAFRTCGTAMILLKFHKWASACVAQKTKEVERMQKYILKRILLMIPILFGVLFIVFTINHFMPGDPVYALLGTSCTEEQYAAKQAELGLDKTFWEQFVIYVKNIVTKLDLGTSYQTNRSVTTEILERFPVTMKLGVLGILVTVIVGVPFGIISATKQYSALDYIVTVVSMFFASMPSFWMALMGIILFSYKLQWLPASGLFTWKHYILPVACLGLSPVATVTRMTRSSMLDVIRQDYIRTARAKGLSEGVVIRKHALKNALIPVLTVIGMQLGTIVAGSTVVEAIFSINGTGSLLMTAINGKNYPVIMGVVLFLSVSICVMNLVVDLVYGFVDPRIMAQYSGGGKKKNKKKEKKEEAPV